MVIFGASAPLGLITPVLRKAGVRRAIAITHGHEAGWAALPGARQLLRRIGDETDVVTYLGEYFRVRVAGALTPAAAARMARLHPGVDAGAFRPDPEGRQAIRDRYGLGRPPGGGLRVPSRPAQRPGHADAGLAGGAARVPEAALLIVGGGRRGGRARLRGAAGVASLDVVFTGPVPQGASRALRGGRCLRDAVPHRPAAWT